MPHESGCVSGRSVVLEQFASEQLGCEPMFQSDSEHWQGPSVGDSLVPVHRACGLDASVVHPGSGLLVPPSL